ncbi:Hypothetical predicted protein, partial [Olea europaea subsp. europaea]
KTSHRWVSVAAATGDEGDVPVPGWDVDICATAISFFDLYIWGFFVGGAGEVLMVVQPVDDGD